jgi:O-antigen ligase
VAIVQQAGDPRLIYGRWMPHDEGARPFGPFVNRNHFATWVLMAFPLAVGYVAAAVSAHKPGRRIAGEMAVMLQGLGTGAAWTAIAAGVMILGLVTSTSRSGLIGLSVSFVTAAWIGRRRMDRRTRLWGLAGAVVLASVVFACVNMEPLVWRVEETLAVGAGGRPQVWRETVPIVHDFWMTGTGLGSFQTAMLVYQQMNRAVFVNQAHSQYLQLLAEGGVLVAAPVLLAVFAFLRLFVRRLKADLSPSVWIRIGGMTALVAVAVQSFWETGLRMPANGVLFAIAAAIAVHRPAGREASAPSAAVALGTPGE